MSDDEDYSSGPPSNKMVGHYGLGKVIGKGGFGKVYTALDLETGRQVAIKRIDKSGMPKKQLPTIQKELELLTKLDHPNVVRLYDSYDERQYIYFVMEYIEGGSLYKTMKSYGSIPERLLARYIFHTLKGLDYLHAMNVIHRDIKGANIMLTKEGQVKLVDFGTAKDSDATRNMTVVGTPYWMAPEIIQMEGGGSFSDIWSLGCTVIELICGQPPFYDIGNMQALFAMVDTPHPPLPAGISPELEDFLLKCFDKNVERRPTAGQLQTHAWIAKNYPEAQQLATPASQQAHVILDDSPARAAVGGQRNAAGGLTADSIDRGSRRAPSPTPQRGARGGRGSMRGRGGRGTMRGRGTLRGRGVRPSGGLPPQPGSGRSRTGSYSSTGSDSPKSSELMRLEEEVRASEERLRKTQESIRAREAALQQQEEELRLATLRLDETPQRPTDDFARRQREMEEREAALAAKQAEIERRRAAMAKQQRDISRLSMHVEPNSGAAGSLEVNSPGTRYGSPGRGNGSQRGSLRAGEEGCAECNLSLRGQKALKAPWGKTYHIACFRCRECKKPLPPGSKYHVKDEAPFCEEDYHRLFGTKCGGCGLPITDRKLIKAVGKQWHADCFRCGQCHLPFSNGRVYRKGENLLCENCK